MPGTSDFELRPGEPVDIDDSAAARVRARYFREVVGEFATGVVVVTALLDGRPVGMTCQTFSSVSLEPPLVSFIPALTSRSWPLMREAGHFCVNVLAAEQAELAAVFASKGADKFAGVTWRAAGSGAPILEGALAYVDCTIEAVHPAGDHDVVIGRVRSLSKLSDAEPLLYHRGAFL
ncbi:flavin reductase family protein [Nocardioides jiangxiensis]|uniref:Flavin reductase family protein n=1 Tax=Nocardioides jiangxiensis TaxID=3064524 RepID=A0ABT9B8B2_9ACTN|nr:flavin reductase family protein [Nocardioides sp. WY-20]MDO7869521.1 flavin reductase family protein [Nocardioides sp. WY-20]